MSNDKLMTILHRPHLSEKSSVAMREGYYTFAVAKIADKKQIAKAIELMFKVNVEQVRTLNVKGSARNFRQLAGRTKSWKKAYVKLREGQSIDFGLGGGK